MSIQNGQVSAMPNPKLQQICEFIKKFNKKPLKKLNQICANVLTSFHYYQTLDFETFLQFPVKNAKIQFQNKHVICLDQENCEIIYRPNNKFVLFSQTVPDLFLIKQKCHVWYGGLYVVFSNGKQVITFNQQLNRFHIGLHKLVLKSSNMQIWVNSSVPAWNFNNGLSSNRLLIFGDTKNFNFYKILNQVTPILQIFGFNEYEINDISQIIKEHNDI